VHVAVVRSQWLLKLIHISVALLASAFAITTQGQYRRFHSRPQCRSQAVHVDQER